MSYSPVFSFKEYSKTVSNLMDGHGILASVFILLLVIVPVSTYAFFVALYDGMMLFFDILADILAKWSKLS